MNSKTRVKARGWSGSSVRGGTIKCTATSKGADGTTCTVEGTCKVDSAKDCEKELAKAISGCCG